MTNLVNFLRIDSNRFSALFGTNGSAQSVGIYLQLLMLEGKVSNLRTSAEGSVDVAYYSHILRVDETILSNSINWMSENGFLSKTQLVDPLNILWSESIHAEPKRQYRANRETKSRPINKEGDNNTNNHSFNSLSLIPSLDDVREMIRKLGLTVDANSFFDHYSKKSWRSGGKKIKNWIALLKTWNDRDNTQPTSTTDGGLSW